MTRTCVLFAISVGLLVLAATAQNVTVKRLDGSTITPAEIDATVTRVMHAAEVPGAAIVLFNDEKVAYLKTYGVRDKDQNLPLTANSVMTAASLSKVAFAYMVMQLVDEGSLELDKPVYEYLPKPLPEYPNYVDLARDQRYKKITARMLLDHSSGFPNWRWINDDRKLNINFEPGARFAYSGEGIDLLQLVVETITNTPLEELMQKRVFQPLGMTRTSMMWQSRFDSDYANGCDEYGRSLGPEKRKTADAAGSMLTTPADFARFMEAVPQEKAPAGKGLLSHKTRELMLSSQVQIYSKHEFPTLVSETTDENKIIRLSYGLAWGLYWTPYGKAFFKEGHAEGWRNYTVCFDEKKVGILIMTNSSNGEGIYKELVETLLKNPYTPIEWEGFTPYDKLPPRPPLKQHKVIVVDAKVLEGYVGSYGLPPNVVLKITRSGDHLAMQENDEPVQQLLAEGPRAFFSEMADDVYTFEVDAQGRATVMTVRTDGRDIPIKRLP
ncbi:MAG TPA: serine hydrolase [Candidatus Acidoferrales bacterium]|jgi:CubicO group peptidase (beta-lactamase class C family)|nr:serine hydrolase [Candidatus Acidoferrales bacterium]